MLSNTKTYLLSSYNDLIHIEENSEQFLIDSLKSPTWQMIVQAQIGKLLRLEDNWDSYGAKALSVSTARAMYSVLDTIMRNDTPAPTIVPTTNNTMQAEWHTRKIDLEIEVISDSLIDVYFEDHTTAHPAIDEQLNVDLTKLGECIGLLTTRT